MNLKCNLNEEERERAFGMFDGMLTVEEEERIKSCFPQYLFFQMNYIDDGWSVSADPVRICTCTACGAQFEGVRINGAHGKMHNEPVTCPYCGRQLVAKAVGKYKYDMPSLENWIKTAIARRTEDGALLIEAGDARRRYTHEDLTGPIDWYPSARYYFARGKVQMWKQIVMEWAHSKPVMNWQTAKTICDPFNPVMWTYNGSYQIFGLDEAIRGTAFEYCQIQRFYYYSYACENTEQTARWWVKYLAAAAFYPQIEMAVKWNLGDAVHDLISDGKKNAKLLNWKATDPAGFLRVSKTDAKAFIQSGMEFDDLKLWKEIREKAKVSFAEYAEILNQFQKHSIQDMLACAEKAGCDFRKAIRYVQSLNAGCSRYALPVTMIVQYWKDYLNMAEQMGYDLTEKTVAMPKDLKDRHDTAASILKAKTEAIQMEHYRKRKKKLERTYAFTLAGYSIIVPAGAEEIVQEGKTLHHCVGGYAARHVEGKTTILFLRKARRPERSFLTIEITESGRKKTIKQIHGFKNENYTSKRRGTDPQIEYAWFLQPWMDWVNAGSKRDKSGNPIMEAVKTG